MPPTTAACICAKNITTPNGQSIDFTLKKGEVLVVTGASGTGKSLLLRAVADLYDAGGQVYLNGIERRDIAAPKWRRAVCYVAAESAFWHETLAEHLQNETPDYAQQLGLNAKLLTAPIKRLSTGEKQRGALLRALAINPKILLLDEPTGPLDTATTLCVEAVLQDFLTRGGAIILVTHDDAQADRLGNHRLELEQI